MSLKETMKNYIEADVLYVSKDVALALTKAQEKANRYQNLNKGELVDFMTNAWLIYNVNPSISRESFVAKLREL